MTCPLPTGSGVSAVELSTEQSHLYSVKCLSCCPYISLISVSNEGSCVDVPSTGPGSLFSICLNVCVCVSSFEDDSWLLHFELGLGSEK